jgi:flavodoxin
MNILIVYSSVYGNTEQIAKAIANSLNPLGNVKLVRADQANPSELESIEILIVGSPTQAGRPTTAIKEFLSKIPAGALKNIGVAVFDTRMDIFFTKLFGYAAPRIAESLKEKDGHLVLQPEGFIVKGKEGPLKPGELERAASWAKGIKNL